MKNSNQFLAALPLLAAATLLTCGVTSSVAGDPDTATRRSPNVNMPTNAQVDVTDIKFSEFFKLPIGPRGLEPTEKLISLSGKKVRLLGFMAREEEPAPGVFIFAPLPVKIADRADGAADDLPPTATFVHVEKDADKVVPYTPGLLLLTGRLEVGAKNEPLDRVSTVRLYLDPPAVVSQAPREKSARDR